MPTSQQGKQGLAILDIENPEQPKLDQVYNANGQINDAHDVKVGMTYVSLFAYIADGHNGLRIVQLTSPEETLGNYGFSPRPTPRLIASSHTLGPALAISEGIDRDRAIDENGNQLAVFGRRGARPFNFEELLRLFMRKGATGQMELYTVPEYRDLRNRYGTPRGGSSAWLRRMLKQDRAVLLGLLTFSLPLAAVWLYKRDRRLRKQDPGQDESR
jgi:hypothetical protein